MINANQAASHSEAQEAMLRSPETLSEWLSVKCKGVEQVAYMPAMRDVTEEDFTHWTIARLDALSRSRHQPALTRAAAIDAINARFLADPETVAEVERIAIKIETGRAEQEREERLDLMDQCVGFPVLARLARLGERS